MVDKEGGSVCPHCKKVISTANFDLHAVHCKRNLEKCQRCGEMVARVRAAEHFDEFHALVPCTLCQAKIEVSDLARHNLNQCPKRETICPYCEFSMPAEDSVEHEYFCGSRTDLCVYCNKYITNRERLGHDVMVHGFEYDKEVKTSGDGSSSAEPVEVSSQSRGPGQRSGNHLRKLWVTAALGAAVFLVSAYFGRRPTARGAS
ncbi:hypothetical protein KFL_000860240 [Klebsormidium nitens]|uniref:TRAF-type domain-containing protein n=1 Tax=Klebsormidium nitens TaxID=105231 RepID=A0A1Y1HV08_KLENI|nr:hypothetical protein KFL_000860240 [Klebsormidium nitens]|eukprot:GAQ81652.1 hypothetical protein KFL_000860240 [Klebsormidium nitens]